MTALVEVRGLSKTFHRTGGRRRSRVAALQAVDLDVTAGRTLGLVGESGSGKSTLARCILGLQRPDDGSIRFDGEELLGASPRRLRAVRRRIQVVFQDPYASLDPRWPVGRSVRESLDAFRIGSAATRSSRVLDLLDRVGLSADLADRLPAELSGGQRQRVSIAAALASSPDVLIADEPVSALDVSVQAQILNLVTSLQADLGLAVLFVSHDLAVIRHVSHRVAVMYLGRVVEEAAVDELFAAPTHGYTQALLAAVPMPGPAGRSGAGHHPVSTAKPPALS